MPGNKHRRHSWRSETWKGWGGACFSRDNRWRWVGAMPGNKHRRHGWRSGSCVRGGDRVYLSWRGLDSEGDLKPFLVAAPSGALDFHAMVEFSLHRHRSALVPFFPRHNLAFIVCDFALVAVIAKQGEFAAEGRVATTEHGQIAFAQNLIQPGTLWFYSCGRCCVCSWRVMSGHCVWDWRGCWNRVRGGCGHCVRGGCDRGLGCGRYSVAGG